jgi:hypothetical protein
VKLEMMLDVKLTGAYNSEQRPRQSFGLVAALR